MMKVLGLCRNFKKMKTLWDYLNDIKDIELEFIICRTPSMSLKLFFSSQMWQFISSSNYHKKTIIRLILAKKFRITPRHPHSPKVLSFIKRKKYDVGLHGISVIYKKEFIDCFRLGILNPHQSLLPKYRGRTPIEWAILNNDEIGTTVFFIDEKIDTGRRTIIQKVIDVSMFDNLKDIKEFMALESDKLFSDALIKLTKDESYFITKEGKSKLYLPMPDELREEVDNIILNNFKRS